MPAGGELLTLQFGHVANYVGAHFWNLQDALIDYSGTDAADDEVQLLFVCTLLHVYVCVGDSDTQLTHSLPHSLTHTTHSHTQLTFFWQHGRGRGFEGNLEPQGNSSG